MTTETAKKEYKVQKVKIKNFKNIEELEIDLHGKSVFLIGENELNKSSIIQAIWIALCNVGKPKKPIREGADRAEILVIVGADGKEYEIEKVFTEKTEKLEITSPEGFKSQKLESLAKIVGDIDFDIMHFVDLVNSAAGRREQVKMIRSFLPPEVNGQIDAINENIKNIEANRTELNANIKRLKVDVSAKDFTDTERETYREPVVVADLLEQQDKAEQINSKIATQERELQHQKTSITTLDKQIEEAEKSWKALVEQKVQREEKIKGIEAELANATKIDIAPIKEKILKAGEHNNMVEAIKAHDKKAETLAAAESQYKQLADERDKKNAEKAKLIADSKLPIDGLTFDEDTLYLNNIPLDETQQSTSQLLEIGLKLTAAKMKGSGVRIARVPRAESIGTKRLRDMMAFAKQENIQVFYEEVQRGQEELKIQLIEG